MAAKDYERARLEAVKKYKGRLEEAEHQNRLLRQRNDRLLCENLELEAKVETQKEWIERLLEYTELDPEEAKLLIQKQRIVKGIDHTVSSFSKLLASSIFFQ